MSEKDVIEEVREFLAAYDAAFQTFEGSRIAPFYHAPCVTVRGDGSIHSFPTRPEIEKFFDGVARSIGLTGSMAEPSTTWKSSPSVRAVSLPRSPGSSGAPTRVY